MSPLRKLVNYYFPIWDFAYILQLEEYELARYWKQVRLRLFKRNFEKRDHLRYTVRMKMTLAKFTGIIVFTISATWYFSPVAAFALLFAAPIYTPYLLGVSSWFVSFPVRLAAKRKLQKAAHLYKSVNPNTKTITITGSFGKTTAKYLLAHVLQYDFKVDYVPNNFNTALGVAEYILSKKGLNQPDYFIVEMGAYTRGDIAETVSVVAPDLAIITILGDQHLERFGSEADLIHGKSEIFTTDPKTKCYVTDQSLVQIKQQNINVDRLVAVDVPVNQKSTPFLVKQLALDLGVSPESIDASIKSFVPPDRRNNIIVRDGVTIIDNSYNISPMVAEAMLKEASVVAKNEGKNLVVMTAGIGEQGELGPAANAKFGELISHYATRAITHPSVYIAELEEALTVPYTSTPMGLDVSERPSAWIDPEKELLLWLTDHSDLSYI